MEQTVSYYCVLFFEPWLLAINLSP